jgi:hypothetical protein
VAVSEHASILVNTFVVQSNIRAVYIYSIQTSCSCQNHYVVLVTKVVLAPLLIGFATAHVRDPNPNYDVTLHLFEWRVKVQHFAASQCAITVYELGN